MINGKLVDASDGKPADYAEILDKIAPRDMWVGNLLNNPDSDWLEVSRTILDSNDYCFYGAGFPNSDVLANANPAIAGIPPLQQLDGIVTSYNNALLISITVTSLQSEGVAYRVFDNNNKWEAFHGEFCEGNLVGEYDSLPDPTLPQVSTILNPPNFIPGQYFLSTPWPISGDGSLGISIINKSPNYNIAQVFFGFAIPRNNFYRG